MVPLKRPVTDLIIHLKYPANSIWQSGMAFFNASAVAWCAELSSGPDNPTAMHSGAKHANAPSRSLAPKRLEARHDISCLAHMYRSSLVRSHLQV